LSLTATKIYSVTAGAVVSGSAAAKLIAMLKKLPSYKGSKTIWTIE